MSFKPEVEVSRKWESNALLFETREEAQAYAEDLMTRWWSVSNCRAVEDDRAVTHRWVDGKLERIDDHA